MFNKFSIQHFYFFLGLIITIIRFPSNLGICSNAPMSESSCTNFNSKISPLSLNTIVLPRKKTYAFTLLPSSRNLRACASLNWKSWSSVFGQKLTVIHDLTYRRNGIRRNLHQIHFLLFRQFDGVVSRHYLRLCTFNNQTDLA